MTSSGATKGRLGMATPTTARGALFATPARLALAVTAGLGLGAGFGTSLALTAQAVPAGATSSHARTITVSTASVSHIGTVLTTASGLTLYRFTEDPAGGSTCTGACAKVWPPLLAAKGTHIKGPKGVKGLSLIEVPNGHWQVAFHNVALYRFEGDKKKGQAKGQGIAGEWFAVLKSGIPAATAAHASSSTSTAAPTSTSTQPAVATQSTAPPPTNPPPTSPPPTMTPPTAPPPTTTPTTPPPPTTTPTTTPAGGYGY
jgi:predicted lipoprotein with Yx(FWY)xxD motif